MVVLRSLTKIHQMAGLRMGYVIASRSWILRLKERQPSWSMNALGLKVSERLVRDCMTTEDAYLDTSRAFYRIESKRVREELSRMGFEVKSSPVNFYIIKVDDDDGFIRFMLERGIIVRHTKNHRGLDGEYVRVALLDREANDRFLDCLRSLKVKILKSECKS